MNTLEVAGREALAELAIHGAPLLKANHTTGECGSPCACPVAKWLDHRTGHDGWFVYMANAIVYANKNPARNVIASVPLPNPVITLVHDIDRGRHPDLMA